ncbi:MAG: hypothetical protein Kow0029_28600 [Candidatus Rifleibacteriota bacterium]
MDWELIFIVVAIVYSIWSEANKQKKEEQNIDFDFSELSSIDDLIQQNQNSVVTGASQQDSAFTVSRNKKNKREKRRRKENAAPVTQDTQPVFERVNYDQIEGRTDVDYDKTPDLALIPEAEMQAAFLSKKLVSDQQSRHTSLGRQTIVQAFIMSEVMKRYDINRIYERIPGIRDDLE